METEPIQNTFSFLPVCLQQERQNHNQQSIQVYRPDFCHRKFPVDDHEYILQEGLHCRLRQYPRKSYRQRIPCTLKCIQQPFHLPFLKGGS